MRCSATHPPLDHSVILTHLGDTLGPGGSTVPTLGSHTCHTETLETPTAFSPEPVPELTGHLEGAAPGGGSAHLDVSDLEQDKAQQVAFMVQRLKELYESVRRRHGQPVTDRHLGALDLHIEPWCLLDSATSTASPHVPTLSVTPIHTSPGQHLSLTVATQVHFSPDHISDLTVLVDTGAQVSLINRDLVPTHLWTNDVPHVRFRTANQSLLAGGDQAVHVVLYMKTRTESGKCFAIMFPALLYGASIRADVILGYPWLKEATLAVVPLDHAMVWLAGPELMWIDGIQTTPHPPVHATDLHHLPMAVHSPIPEWCEDLDDELWEGGLAYSDPGSDDGNVPACWIDEVSVLERWFLHYEDFDGTPQLLSRAELCDVVSHFTAADVDVLGVVQTEDLPMDPEVVRRRQAIMCDYGGTVFSETTPGNPPVRGPLGEAEIHLQPNTLPRKQRPFYIVAERHQAMINILNTLM